MDKETMIFEISTGNSDYVLEHIDNVIANMSEDGETAKLFFDLLTKNLLKFSFSNPKELSKLAKIAKISYAIRPSLSQAIIARIDFSHKIVSWQHSNLLHLSRIALEIKGLDEYKSERAIDEIAFIAASPKEIDDVDEFMNLCRSALLLKKEYRGSSFRLTLQALHNIQFQELTQELVSTLNNIANNIRDSVPSVADDINRAIFRNKESAPISGSASDTSFSAKPVLEDRTIANTTEPLAP